MDFIGVITGSVAIVSLFVGLPAVVLSFVYKNNKNRRQADVEKLKHQKKVLELEIKKQESQIKLLEAENKKMDRLIYDAVPKLE